MKKTGLFLLLLSLCLVPALAQAKPSAKPDATPSPAPAPAKGATAAAPAQANFINIGLENFAPLTGSLAYGYDLGALMIRGTLGFTYSNEIPPNERHTDAGFGAGVAVLFPFVRGLVEPYLGIGVDFDLVNSQDVILTTIAESTTTTFSVGLPLGVEFKVSPNFGIGAESGIKLSFVNEVPDNNQTLATNTTSLGLLNPGIFLRFHF